MSILKRQSVLRYLGSDSPFYWLLNPKFCPFLLRICVYFSTSVLGLVAQSCPTLCNPVDCSPPGSSIHGDSLDKDTGVGCHAPLLGNLPNPGIKPRSPALQTDSLPSEPPDAGKCRLIKFIYLNLSPKYTHIQNTYSIRYSEEFFFSYLYYCSNECFIAYPLLKVLFLYLFKSESNMNSGGNL